ncbi:MAG: hypothetical protein IT210_18725 [Armatimonadetes bacterium]|nr:hypothetical protein [Armatimonadota bacterium]
MLSIGFAVLTVAAPVPPNLLAPRPAWELPWHWRHAVHPGHGNPSEALIPVTPLRAP